MANVKKGNSRMFLWVTVITIYFLLSAFAYVLIQMKISIDQKNQWNWGWTILSIELLHFGLSFRTVGPKSLGAILLFGRPLYQVGSGLVFVPFVVCYLIKETKLVIQERFPAEPELVDKSGDDTKSVTPGFVKPIRVTTASWDMLSAEFKKKSEDYKDHSLNESMTLEPSVVVRFQIQRDNYISFLTNIGSIDEAVSQMRDTVDSMLNIEFAKRTPALLLLDKEDINHRLLEKIKILVGEKPDPANLGSFNPSESWGINVINVQIADVDVSKKINQSLRDVADSILRKKETVTEAEAKKRARELEGEGDANARLAFLIAEAGGLEKIAKIAETEGGKLAVIAKTQEEALKGSQYSIIPEGIGSLISGVQEVLKKTKSPNKDDDKKKTRGEK